MINDVDLVKEDTGVEDVEGGVVDGSRKYNIFEELQSVRVMYLPLDAFVAYRYGLMVARTLAKEVTIVGLVGGEFRVVCGR